ncbi:MAG: SDR family NAD(P)-dependent oxidoreductase [Polyangiaceae bacterium]
MTHGPLAGRSALVTGGGRGIGRAIAERLAADGAKVTVTGRTAAELDEVAKAIDGTILVLDLLDRAALEREAKALAERGGVDILVNNAGISASVPFDRTDDELWDRTMELNARAPFALARALVPPMIQRKHGRVVNVASNAGRVGYAYTVAYCAAKHALVGFTRALAAEIARSGVTVNAVCPGWVETKMLGEVTSRIRDKTGRSEADARDALAQMSPQRRIMEATEVAHLVASLCAHEARGIHGQAIPLDGGQVMA